MRIAFLDPLDWDFTVETPFERPLGGSQSAICYLAAALARRGHEVFTLTGTTVPGVYREVHCLSLVQSTAQVIRDLGLDFFITSNTGDAVTWLREHLGNTPKQIIWTGHAADQPAIASLADPQIRDAHDAFAFVSDWQRAQYVRRFGIPTERTAVQRNAIAPVFENLFSSNPVRPPPNSPPVLAYTSTPFRGLNVLIELFPQIRQELPHVSLRVFSSMQVYSFTREADDQQFGPLYQACRDTDGIEYVGSVKQPELARQLRGATALAYPNTFAETSCISVMEAMAAGCSVLSSELGALPETAAGFATLISLDEGFDTYKQNFRRALVELLRQHEDPADADQLVERLQRQVDYVNEECTWSRRAQQWESWLERI